MNTAKMFIIALGLGIAAFSGLWVVHATTHHPHSCVVEPTKNEDIDHSPVRKAVYKVDKP